MTPRWAVRGDSSAAWMNLESLVGWLVGWLVSERGFEISHYDGNGYPVFCDFFHVSDVINSIFSIGLDD